VLGQAGTSVRGAYDVLVSMSIISYFIPFLYMFAALIRVQREPVRADVMRVPGGKPVAVLFGGVGFLTTAAAIVLACVPAADEPNKELAVVKIIGLSAALIVIGAIVYLMGQRRALVHSSEQGLP
jgi:glutamate:GABA antiporter